MRQRLSAAVAAVVVTVGALALSVVLGGTDGRVDAPGDSVSTSVPTAATISTATTGSMPASATAHGYPTGAPTPTPTGAAGDHTAAPTAAVPSPAAPELLPPDVDGSDAGAPGDTAGAPCGGHALVSLDSRSGAGLTCSYLGVELGYRWVVPLPILGVHDPGTSCGPDETVGSSPSGRTVQCVGGVWRSGP